MSGDANTNRPFLSLLLLGIFDFCCILIGLEQISTKQIASGVEWIAAGVGSGLIGYYWPQLKKWRGRETEIEFTPGVDPFVQWNGPDSVLYRVAVKSKAEHPEVSLVISAIDPHPGPAVTEIPLMQRHDRPALNADGKWKRTFDLHQEQPLYVDVVQKDRNEDSIGIPHTMVGDVDQTIPTGNYIFTLETRGSVSAHRKFSVTVDNNGVLGFSPLLSRTKSWHKWGLGISIVAVVALICYGVIHRVRKDTHASDPASQGVTAHVATAQGMPQVAIQTPAPSEPTKPKRKPAGNTRSHFQSSTTSSPGPLPKAAVNLRNSPGSEVNDSKIRSEIPAISAEGGATKVNRLDYQQTLSQPTVPAKGHEQPPASLDNRVPKSDIQRSAPNPSGFTNNMSYGCNSAVVVDNSPGTVIERGDFNVMPADACVFYEEAIRLGQHCRLRNTPEAIAQPTAEELKNRLIKWEKGVADFWRDDNLKKWNTKFGDYDPAKMSLDQLCADIEYEGEKMSFFRLVYYGFEHYPSRVENE